MDLYSIFPSKAKNFKLPPNINPDQDSDIETPRSTVDTEVDQFDGVKEYFSDMYTKEVVCLTFHLSLLSFLF